MVYSGGYALVLVLHLLTAVFVVGPLAVAAVTAPRAARAGSVEALQASLRTTRGYALASLVVVVLGSAMVGLGSVGAAWSFGQAWVSASYALWLVAVALTLAVVVPAQEAALAALAQAGSVDAPARRMAIGGGLAMLAWVAIVVLMVYKPGV